MLPPLFFYPPLIVFHTISYDVRVRVFQFFLSSMNFLIFVDFATHLFHLGFYAPYCLFARAFQFRVDCLGIYYADNWSSGNADTGTLGKSDGQLNCWTVGPGFVTIQLIWKGVGWSKRVQVLLLVESSWLLDTLYCSIYILTHSIKCVLSRWFMLNFQIHPKWFWNFSYTLL